MTDPVILLLTVGLATVIVAILLLVACGASWDVYGKKKKGGDINSKLPPGDMGMMGCQWPIAGPIFSPFKSFHPVGTLSDFMQLQFSRHGKIFSTRYHGKTVVVSADLELNRFVLQIEMTSFQNQPPPRFMPIFGERNMIFLTGEDHRSKKSLLLGFLNSWQIQTRFLTEVEEAAKRTVTSWRQKSLILATEEASKFLFNLAIEKAIGINPDDPEVEKLRKAFVSINNGVTAFPFNLPFTDYSKALKARDIISSIIKREAEGRNLNSDKMDEKENDLIWYYSKNNPSMSTQSICDDVIAFIFAGMFNTQTTIGLAMYFLRQCPKSLQQLKEEFKQKMNDTNTSAKLTWEDYKNMEFCQSVINETLRLGNVIPSSWRKALSDINFKGYVIPQGAFVLTHFEAMHLDPSAFENPNTFDPWRWLDIKKSNNNWMPFGGGVRRCIGSEIARIQIAVFLRHVILNYDWELIKADHPVVAPGVKFPKGLPLRIHPLGEKNP